MNKINVYDGEEIVAQVEYNDNLDVWNGSNYQNGGTGHHLGITRLDDGRYVLIHGTQWQGQKDYAEVVSAEQALQEILKADKDYLLDEPKFEELKKMLDGMPKEEA